MSVKYAYTNYMSVKYAYTNDMSEKYANIFQNLLSACKSYVVSLGPYQSQITQQKTKNKKNKKNQFWHKNPTGLHTTPHYKGII